MLPHAVSTKNSTLPNHFTVEKQNNHKLHTTHYNSHSQVSNSHSNSNDDLVMSQDEIDHLFTEDTQLNDIT